MRTSPLSINFKANIKFCSPEEFDRYRPANFEKEYPCDFNLFFKEQEQYRRNNPNQASWPWNIESIRSEHNLVTGKVFTCLSGGVTGLNNPSGAVRYHFVPEKYNFDAFICEKSDIKTKFDGEVAKIRDDQHCGLIVGGDSTALEDIDARKKFFFDVKKYFESKKIDASYFWGQDLGKDKRGVDCYYTGEDDTWRILKYKPNSKDTVSSIKDIRENFSLAHIGKNDKLYFKDSKKPIVAKEFDEG